MKEVLVVVVNYHKADRLVLGVESLLQQVGATLRIRLVDNSGSDLQAAKIRSLQRYGVEVDIADRNLGYTAAVNRAVGAWNGPVVLMSPDIILEDSSTVERSLKYLDKYPKLGIVAPEQVNDDGSIVELGREFPKFFDQVSRRLFGVKDQTARSVGSTDKRFDWVQSSFMFVREGLFQQCGGLDERYFLFMADTEFCKKVHKHGFEVAVVQGLGRVRADGVRASAGGLLSVFKSKAVRIHVSDALKYYFSPR